MATKGKETSVRETVIDCGESLDIPVVSALYTSFKAALKKKAPIVLDGSKIEHVDVTGVQLIYAFLEEANKKSISVTWKEKPELLGMTAAQIGMTQI